MQEQTVLIVDDHMLIRETWSRLLGLSKQFNVIGNTGDGAEAVEIAKTQRPNLVLLDINMYPVSGFDILKSIRKFSPVSKVIAVSMHSQPVYAKKMIKGGAKGYVTKNSSSDELLLAINSVIDGQIYVCHEVKDKLAQQSFADEDTGIVLTERELEIIGYVKGGLSSKEIASRLFITPKTV